MTLLLNKRPWLTIFAQLAILEHRNGQLNHGSLSAITAAQKLDGSITAFLAGSGIKSIAEEAAKVGGVEKIVTIENAAYDKVYHHLSRNSSCIRKDSIDWDKRLITPRAYPRTSPPS